MRNIFFTSDTHYGHANVIKYSNRPFASVEEMDREMIARWNAKVPPGGTVYHLGDFAFYREDKIVRILNQLNGQIFYIPGNHDKEMYGEEVRKRFVKMSPYHEISIKDQDATRGVQKIVLCHYPMITWNRAHHGSWMLHGHCHGNLTYPFPARILDVGVDVHNYEPISYEEVKAYMKTVKKPEFPDHHVGD